MADEVWHIFECIEPVGKRPCRMQLIDFEPDGMAFDWMTDHMVRAHGFSPSAAVARVREGMHAPHFVSARPERLAPKAV